VVRYAAPAIAGTLTASAAMNGFAFAAHAEGFLIYPRYPYFYAPYFPRAR
jgi:hypothetical protein